MDCVVRIFLIIRLDKSDLHEHMDCVGEDIHNYKIGQRWSSGKYGLCGEEFANCKIGQRWSSGQMWLAGFLIIRLDRGDLQENMDYTNTYLDVGFT